jgi:hypothetical protein
MIQDTSLEIFLKKIYPNLNARQRVVLHYLRNVGAARTNEEIRTALNVPINHITGRVKELRDLGLVIDAGRRRCEITGNNVHVWAAKHPVLPPAREERPKAEQSSQSLFV